MSHSASTETGTGSIDVSVPTDLTVTSEGGSEDLRHTNIKRHAREIYSITAEKKLLQNINEKLRLELQEKNSQLESFKAQHMTLLNQKNLQNEIKLSEKQAQVNRIEGELMASNDELKVLKERAAKELAHLLQKCFEFQQNQSRLMVKHDEIKSTLTDLQLSESEFTRMQALPRDQLNLQKFAALRVYEMVMPLKMKMKELETVKSSLQNTLATTEKELENKYKENAKKTEEVNDLRERLVDYGGQCDELRSEMKLDDYRVHNFDRIKRERDKYEQDRETLLREKSELELNFSVCKREKKILEEKITELKMKFRFQEQELSKYKNEYFDTKSQLEKGKETTIKTSSKLRLEQERNDDIHEKFLKAREEIIFLSGRLQDAKSEIKTWKEKYFTSSKMEKETKEELNELSKRHAELSNNMEYLEGKYVKEKDMLKLEISESRARYNALLKTHNDIVERNSNLLKENKQIQSSVREEKFSKEDEMMKLKQDTINLQRELDQYKALENDYMSTLRVFASASDKGSDPSQTRIPVSSIVKGKLSEETISLTRRILHLEKQNFEACSTIRKFTITLDQMRSSLSSYKAALSLAGKPSEVLLERIRSQEENIIVLEEALLACRSSKESAMRDWKTLEHNLGNITSCREDTEALVKEFAHLKTEISNLNRSVTQIIN